MLCFQMFNACFIIISLPIAIFQENFLVYSNVHSSFAFRGFLLCGFANLWGFPNENASLQVDRSINIFQQLEEVFEPCCVTFKEMKERKSSSHQSFCKIKKNTNNIKMFPFNRQISALCRRPWNLTLAKSEE